MVTPDTSVDWKKVREQLKAKRNELFHRFERSPGDIRLAIEIKILDDEMWDCSEHLQGERDHQE